MTPIPPLTLRCDSCDMVLPDTTARSRCHCGGLLTACQTPPATGSALRHVFDTSSAGSGVWRFGAVVHPAASETAISYPEGNTPLIHRSSLSSFAGIDELLIKHEGLNPTGSFKDRGMTVAVTQARRAGARALICASTGNTSASLAAYAAHADLPALVLVPNAQVAIGKLAQALAYGARTLVVDGDFDTCLSLVEQAADELEMYLVNSVNPFRIEGQKTIVLELLSQLDWDPPDWICLPAGNLGNTSAFGKALIEAHDWGLIDRLPRLVAVQAAGAAPFAAAFERGFDRLVPVAADTLATAIRIGHPASYQRACHAIRATNGIVISVSDRDILAAKAAVDRAGIGAEPASAAAVAGARALAQAGTIRPGERCVAVLTGNLLKDPTTVELMHQSTDLIAEPNRPRHIPATIAALAELVERDRMS